MDERGESGVPVEVSSRTDGVKAKGLVGDPCVIVAKKGGTFSPFRCHHDKIGGYIRLHINVTRYFPVYLFEFQILKLN